MAMFTLDVFLTAIRRLSGWRMLPLGASIAVTIAAASVAAPALAQRVCEQDTPASASGQIETTQQLKPKKLGGDEWVIVPRGRATGQCQIDMLIGSGRLPAGCSAGRSFRASGVVLDAIEMMEDELPYDFALLVRSISCK